MDTSHPGSVCCVFRRDCQPALHHRAKPATTCRWRCHWLTDMHDNGPRLTDMFTQGEEYTNHAVKIMQSITVWRREASWFKNNQLIDYLLTAPFFNSLWPSDAILWHRSGSTLTQVRRVSCLMVPSEWVCECLSLTVFWGSGHRVPCSPYKLCNYIHWNHYLPSHR